MFRIVRNALAIVRSRASPGPTEPKRRKTIPWQSLVNPTLPHRQRSTPCCAAPTFWHNSASAIPRSTPGSKPAASRPLLNWALACVAGAVRRSRHFWKAVRLAPAISKATAAVAASDSVRRFYPGTARYEIPILALPFSKAIATAKKVPWPLSKVRYVAALGTRVVEFAKSRGSWERQPTMHRDEHHQTCRKPLLSVR